MTRNADPRAAAPARPAAATCPICGRPSAEAARLRPFCSVRCADVDLGRWITGQYRVPAPPDEEASPDPDAPAS
ncbi:MAG: DNA gyrase inhibitor YacG [Proteobacteria bacterium]|nr:DNA gyrase inhibitor YacG [Pseudomonadota bacterium]